MSPEGSEPATTVLPLLLRQLRLTGQDLGARDARHIHLAVGDQQLQAAARALVQAHAGVLRLQTAHCAPSSEVSGRSARAVAHEGEHPADRAGSTDWPVVPGRLLEHPRSLAELPEPHAVVADQDGGNASVVGWTGGSGCGRAAAVADDTSQLLSSATIAANRPAATKSIAREKNSTASKSSPERTQPTSHRGPCDREAHGVRIHVARRGRRPGGGHRVAALEAEGGMGTRTRKCRRWSSAVLDHAPVQIRKSSPSSLSHGLQVALVDEPQGGSRREIGEGVEVLRVVGRSVPGTTNAGDVVVRHRAQVLDEAVEVRGHHHPLRAVGTAAEQPLVPCRITRDVVVDEHPTARLHPLAARGVQRREHPRTRRSPVGHSAGQMTAAVRQPEVWQPSE